jgi:signal transduction histidine kinase
MNLATPRRRLFAAFAVVLTAGFAVNRVAWYLYPPIYARLERWCPGLTGVCGLIREESSWLLHDAALAVLAVVLLALLPLLASWVMRPVRNLVPVVEQVGPQNLGYRVPPASGRPDELAALSDALNRMMDRIMVGYEGQRRFAANASHELRTPLALQRMLVEVGMSQPLSGEQATLLTTQLLQANERNERLIEGLLVLSEADQGLASRTPVRLDQVAAAAAAAHRGEAAARAVQITADLQPTTVDGEQVLLERLVTNLVQNAVKYNHPHGRIHITTGGAAALAVTNTGQMVPPAAVAQLFEPFKRLAGDRIDHSGGAGLGLTIVRSIAQAHHGTVQATALDGGGLRIEVRLPEPDRPHPARRGHRPA